MSFGISKKFLMAAMIALGVPGFLACEDKGTGGAASLAVLGAAAVYQGIGSPFASAAPRPAPPSHAMTPTTEQSLPAYPASADADVGPGQVEPVLVGVP